MYKISYAVLLLILLVMVGACSNSEKDMVNASLTTDKKEDNNADSENGKKQNPKESDINTKDFNVEKYLNENYEIENTHYVTDIWENEETGRKDYTVKILPDTKAFDQEINEIFKNGANVSPYNDERIKEMFDIAPKIMDDLTDDKIHIDSVNWVSFDGEFTVTLIQDYENSDLNTGDNENLSQNSSNQIEYARVWLQLGPNQDIDELNVQHIPAGTPLNPDDDTNVSFPEDVIQLRGSRTVDGIVTYSGNGDGTINVYNVPSRWYGGSPPPDDIDKNKVREDMEDIINNTKLVNVDPGDDEEIEKLIELIIVH